MDNRPWTIVNRLVRLEGVEPPTYSSVGCRSIQLSYGRKQKQMLEGKWKIERPKMERIEAGLSILPSASLLLPFLVALTGIEPVFRP